MLPKEEKRAIADLTTSAAMRRVQRHRFVGARYRELADTDRPLPIGRDQTISQPSLVAFMTKALELTGKETVLEIGTGSGYQAAILAEIVEQVFTIEIVQFLANRSRRLLADLGYENVQVRFGDGYRGWPENAPFDCIVVTAAPAHIPEPLVDQLKVGGRMIIPVGDQDQDQELVVIRKTESGDTRRSVVPVRFVPMTRNAPLR